MMSSLAPSSTCRLQFFWKVCLCKLMNAATIHVFRSSLTLQSDLRYLPHILIKEITVSEDRRPNDTYVCCDLRDYLTVMAGFPYLFGMMKSPDTRHKASSSHPLTKNNITSRHMM